MRATGDYPLPRWDVRTGKDAARGRADGYVGTSIIDAQLNVTSAPGQHRRGDDGVLGAPFEQLVVSDFHDRVPPAQLIQVSAQKDILRSDGSQSKHTSQLAGCLQVAATQRVSRVIQLLCILHG